MSKIEEFLSEEEEAEVVDAIRRAERKTSGEIRVHIEKTSKGEIWDRAMEVFHLLKMDNTKEDNGVLIYVAIDDRKFIIYGDKGINAVVPKDFWETTKDAIASEFKKGNFKHG
ncbi:TPM domain-containing protein, partial [Salinimicrobium oceani]